MIMVKPAMPYLDVIRDARQRFDVPLGAYQVSGEFSMIVAAARNGWLDLDRAIIEIIDQHTPRRGRHHSDVFCEVREQTAGLSRGSLSLRCVRIGIVPLDSPDLNFTFGRRRATSS